MNKKVIEGKMKTFRRIIIIELMMTLILSMSIIPSFAASGSVSETRKVAINLASRDSDGEVEFGWSKLKKNVTGYEVYVKTGDCSWYLEERTGKGTSSVTFSTTPEESYQVKVRAINRGKITRYYNKKTRRYVSKKTYNKLPKKSRAIKRSVVTKKGAFSDIMTFDAIALGKIQNVNGVFDKNEDAAISWSYVEGANQYEVYREQDGSYKLLDTVTGTSYVDKYYNPTKTINYKVRPMRGSFAGEFSQVLTMRPQDIVTTITKKEPKLVCDFCNEDVTGMTDEEFKVQHTIYFCSKCGLKVQSHNADEIDKHIEDNHIVKEDDPDVEYEDRESAEVTYDAERYEMLADKKDGGNKESTTEHKHGWEVKAKSEQVITGYETVRESHDICQVCNKDLNDWEMAAEKYADEHGLTGTDRSCGSKNPVFKATIEAHIEKHLAEGAQGAGSTRVDIVEVQKPIYKNTTVVTSKCECGAERVVK